MTACTDAYILHQTTCTTGTMYVYPSQVHPHGGGKRPYGSPSRHHRGTDPRIRVVDDDEAIALALLLLD